MNETLCAFLFFFLIVVVVYMIAKRMDKNE